MTAVAYSPDGSTIAVGDDDGNVFLWDPITGETVATFTEPGGNSVSAIAFSPNGAVLAAGAEEPESSSAGDSDSTYLWHVSKAHKGSG